MRKNRCGLVDDDQEDDLVLLLLPEGDFFIQILVCLPIKSLLRFKSVCKSWRELIKSSFFIDLHTATTFNSSKFGSFILHASVDKSSCSDDDDESFREHELLMLSESESGTGGCRWLWSTDYNNITCRAADEDVQPDDLDDQVFKVDDLVLKLDNLGFPPSDKFCNLLSSKYIIGSCNGLVCLYGYFTNQVTLWNPATRQFRNLPKNTIPSKDSVGGLLVLVSFGFDVETKDYKVMLLTRSRPRGYHRGPAGAPAMECLCRVEVYSLSTDSWSLLEGITSLPGHPYDFCLDNLLYLNGSCFFLANFFHTEQRPYVRENDRFIISFDFTKGIITTIQLPDHHGGQQLFLTYFGEKIALYISEIVDDDDDDDDDDFDDDDFDIFKDFDNLTYQDFNIWVLNEHVSSSNSADRESWTNKESWTKLHLFRIEHRRQGEWDFPRGISNDGKFALLETRCSGELGKKMKLYNLVTKEVKKDFLFCNILMSKANPYKPSLVSI